jgi:hypothetical protein
MLNKRLLLIPLLSLDTVLIVLAVYLGISSHNPLKFFDEGGFITWVSALKLFVIAVLSFMILFYSCQEQKEFSWKSPSAIWLLIGLGFVFLAGDELLELHEKADEIIHQALALKETRFLDRIDDLIIGFYLFLGVVFLYVSRHEMLRYLKIYPYIIMGFIISIIMVFLDMYTNLAPGDWISPTILRLSIAEDVLKVYAESCFLMAFFHAMQKARNHGKISHISEKN